MNPMTVPAALLVTGYATPRVCVRHGAPAVFRLGFGNLVKNWPFCARCRTRRWTLMAAAAAAAFIPFFAGFALTSAFASDDAQVEAYVRGTVAAVTVGLVVGAVIGLMNTPKALAKAKITPDHQWVVFHSPHPAFAAEMSQIVEAAQRAYPPATSAPNTVGFAPNNRHQFPPDLS